MCKHGRPLNKSSRIEVSTDKCKKRGCGEAVRGVRRLIVPMKQVTTVEGRGRGDHDLNGETYRSPTEVMQYNTNTKLDRIAWLSSQDPHKEFACLMHHFNEESLINCYLELNGRKAVGIDNINKEQYGKELKANINDLLTRLKDMAYRPNPVKQVLIPKEGKPGATRPLGISCFEDKIIQCMTKKILESIYEPTFYECSYGFRPGRGCHDAIKDLQNYLYTGKTSVVIDIDLGNFFGTIDHDLLAEILETRIKDKRFIRYIKRMFKAGVLSDEELSLSEEGVVQGSVCSPVLANIYAHHVIDTWICDMIKPYLKGEVRLFRYADDAIICCESTDDAEKIRDTLGKRLARFNLHLNEDKTKIVEFSREKAMRGQKQGTFDFLGFTFYWGKSRYGRIIPKLKTAGKRLKSKLAKVKTWIKSNRNKMKLKKLWTTFRKKLAGHNQYYGVSLNKERIDQFFREAKNIFYKWINRRSQRNSMSLKKFYKFMDRNPLPEPRIIHKLF